VVGSQLEGGRFPSMANGLALFLFHDGAAARRGAARPASGTFTNAKVLIHACSRAHPPLGKASHGACERGCSTLRLSTATTTAAYPVVDDIEKGRAYPQMGAGARILSQRGRTETAQLPGSTALTGTRRSTKN